MAADSYTTSNILFAAFLVYAFAEAAGKDDITQRIEIKERGVEVTLSVPSHDAEEYWREYEDGVLAIGDLQNIEKRLGHIRWLIRNLNELGEKVWEAPIVRSEDWFTAAREKLREKQAARR